jgi:hypothetical protein
MEILKTLFMETPFWLKNIRNGPYPVGEGIHMNHGYQRNNIVSRNFIDQYYDTTNYPLVNCQTKSGDCNTVPEVNVSLSCESQITDSWQRSRRAMDLTTDQTPSTSIKYNQLTGNYLLAYNNIECSDYPLAFYTEPALRSSSNGNILPSLAEGYYTFDENHYYDPYWKPHTIGAISMVATVSGDFDNDGRNDDIAVIYEYPNAVTKIHVWRFLNGTQLTDPAYDYKQEAFFEYMGVRWTSEGLGGFDANKIRGRVVSGRFDNADYRNDIAAIYDNGAGGIEIAMFLWNNSTKYFDYKGGNQSWRKIATGFDASKITGRVVSGEFTNDNLDDIATFYKVGTTGTEINMFFSTGSNFSYQGGSTSWWSAASGFNPDKYTDRIVAGDFDNDGQPDDIALFFDAGTNATEVEMFRSNGVNDFTYEGGSGNWWSNVTLGLGGFDSNKIKGRIASGDFDGDEKMDDIAAFYDLGTNATGLVMFKSNGTKPFTYQGGNSAWWSTVTAGDFDANRITGTVVSGDFTNGDNTDDIAAFYDHSNSGGNVRSNVWKSMNNSFSYVNESLGYPWAANFLTGINQGRLQPIKSESDTEPGSEQEFSVYPNPTSDEFTVRYQLLEDQLVVISITYIDGRSIELVREHQSTGEHTMTFKSKDLYLLPGLHMIRIRKDLTTVARKLIVR